MMDNEFRIANMAQEGQPSLCCTSRPVDFSAKANVDDVDEFVGKSLWCNVMHVT
jgi:hypothetical protein